MKQDLRGAWTLVRESTGSRSPVRVPGDNFSALIESGVMSDPYFGTNELDVQWANREDWTFETEFDAGPDLCSRDTVYLNIDSIDTVAEVILNGTSLGTVDDMFIRRRAWVSGILREGKNRLSVRIKSPELAAEEKAAKLPYPVPHISVAVQSPGRNLIRKVQCHSGWDWGPCLMVSGISGAVYLDAPESVRIEHVTTQTSRKGETWKLSVKVETAGPHGSDSGRNSRDETETVFAHAELFGPLKAGQEGLKASAPSSDATKGNGIVRQSATLSADGGVALDLEVKNPELWWPAGYGDQVLYLLRVEAGGDIVEKRIGFRELRLNTDPDEIGRGMRFSINGRDIFAKGANWIPIDALPARESHERYEALIGAAVEANMNMLRVWGGGKYENDEFYEICDEKGILIWQDMMFSCSLYPADKEFLSLVDKEITYQIKRLMDHPCIAIWCGDNEDVGALNWFPESKKNRDRYVGDYVLLNEATIGRRIDELDPSRSFWSSSPSAGRGDFSDTWHKDGSGDMHYWSVWHEGKPFTAYYSILPRFVSEFGYQSFPSLETVKTYAPEDQLNLTSPVMEHHQKNVRGNSIIIESFSRYFRFPEGFDNMLYLSQVQQAQAIKTAVEYWRSKRPVCMGALYWQINDNWPVASWSSIEYSGKWKLLHYAAKRFFAPAHVVAHRANGDDVEIWCLNDAAKPRTGSVRVRFISFAGKVLKTEEGEFSVDADSAGKFRSFTKKDLEALGAPEASFLHVEWTGSDFEVENELFLADPKRCDLMRATVKTETGEDKDGVWVELSSDRPAFYVSLDTNGVDFHFSDNCFTLIPGKPKRVRVVPKVGGTQPNARAVKGAMRVFHLRTTYS